MTADEIIKLAFELGNSIAESEEIQNLKDLQTKIFENREAYELIMRFQDARMKMDNKKKDGLLVAKQEEDHLDILEQQLNSNPIITELMSAQEKFDNLMQAVYFAMNQAITGGDSCSSGCDSCGGQCGL